jgi:O-antigen/teichoic acid export membrane protein
LISGYKSVGIYSAASKLMRILCVLVASVGNVLVPRISNLISIGEKDQAIVILNKSLRIGLALTIPLSFGFYLLADEMIMIMYGAKFADSVVLCKVLAPIIVVAGVANVYTIQYLLPYSRESELFATYFTGTIIAIILNVALIFRMDSMGAAIAMLAAESTICVTAYVFVNRRQSLPIPWKYLLSCTLFCLVFWPITSFIRSWSPGIWLTVISSLIACGLVYGSLQMIFYRDFLMKEFYSLISVKKN